MAKNLGTGVPATRWARPRQAPPLDGLATRAPRTALREVLSPPPRTAGGAAPRTAPPAREAKLADARPAVLILGIYLANYPNYVRSLVRQLSATSCYRVVQRWIALGGSLDAPEVGRVTCGYHPTPAPKFSLVNRLLAQVDVRNFEYVVVVDDDILLPDCFLDRFLAAQSALGFRLAQPARTSASSPVPVYQSSLPMRSLNMNGLSKMKSSLW